MSKLTHFDEQGSARMVDVSCKEETAREAVAEPASQPKINSFNRKVLRESFMPIGASWPPKTELIWYLIDCLHPQYLCHALWFTGPVR
jgi:hypothetical protein